MLKSHLFLALFLRKDHVEATIVEVVTDTVRIPIHHSGVDFHVLKLIILSGLSTLFRFYFDLRHFLERSLGVGREATNNHIFPFVVLVAHQSL